MIMLNPIRTPEYLLERARAGDTDAFGQLLSQYHNYLRLMARALVGATLKLQLDSSDLVQEAFLEAHRDFMQFEGSTEAELLAWLRRILARNLADGARYQKAALRDHRRQQSLESLLEQSSLSVQEALAAAAPTASAVAAQRERAVLLADALESLPADYREVVILRNLEGLKFGEVATRMGRTSGAVRMLWARAIERLSEALEDLE
jgi:RNA polymerase sigma-70 factor, ECF subfamily